MQLRYAITAAALALGAGAGGAAAAPATPLLLVEPPSGLRWSAQEVQAAAEPALHALIARAAAGGHLGCMQRCAQIERVYARVLAAVHAQGGRAAALPWRLLVVRLADEQASALPEGQVVLSESFVREQQMSDEMLAFVLAHEMAHSVLEHERQTLTYAHALLPRHVPRTVLDMYTEMDFNAAFLRLLEPICHQVELEADELGLLIAASAGYAPPRLLDFMRGEAARASGQPRFMSTHPPAALRLQRLQTRLPLAQRVWEASREARRRDRTDIR